MVTGFKGIAIARTAWLHGCDRIVIQPRAKEDGTIIGNESFDEPSVKRIKKEKVKPDTRKKKTGGDKDDRAAMDKKSI